MTEQRLDLAELRARVGRLEQQNRRLKGGAVLLAAGAAAAFLLLRGGSADAQVNTKLPALEAQSLTIRDATGRPRIILGLSPGGGAAVAVYHPNGAIAGNFFTDRDGSSNLALNDGGRVMRLHLNVSRDGSSAVRLYGPNGNQQRAGLLVLKDWAGLHVRDSKGAGRVSAAVSGDDTPSLNLLDAAGKVTWSAK